MPKKGQFTILVVFGLLVLIILGIVLFVRSSIKEETIRVSTEQALSDFLSANSVSNFVDACLKTVSEEAILKGAYQGGVLWNYQGGTITFNTAGYGTIYLPYTGGQSLVNVSYVLQLNHPFSTCNALRNNGLPPLYPYPNKTVPWMDDITNYFSVCPYYTDKDGGFYGHREMPALCTVKGANWQGDPARPSVYSTCEGYYAPPYDNPFQEQVEQYTATNLPKCANFTDMEQQEGVKITIMNRPGVQFGFGREDVTVNATYPVEVTSQGRPPITLNVDFHHVIDARIKEIYEFYRELLYKEALNSSFSFTNATHYTNSRLYRGNFVVNYLRDFCPNCGQGFQPAAYDDLLVVRDIRDKIVGNELAIYGVVKNRPPVLQPVQKEIMLSLIGSADYFDIVAVNGSFIQITPNATDPDGDMVTYEYEGWKTNYTDDCSPTATNILQPGAGYLDPAAPVNSKYPTLLNILNSACPGPITPSANLWESSSQYLTTGRVAAIGPLTAQDIGLHTVRVIATDGGARDYQDVKVLVLNSNHVTRQASWGAVCLNPNGCSIPYYQSCQNYWQKGGAC